MNWLDLVLIIIFVYCLFRGIQKGFLEAMVELLGLVVTIFLAFKFYPLVGNWLEKGFHIAPGLAKAFGFFLILALLEVIYFRLAFLIYRRIPDETKDSSTNKLLGPFPSFGLGLIIVAIILTLILALPLPGVVKNTVNHSFLGSRIVNQTAQLDNLVRNTFGGAIDDTLTFLTKQPNLPFQLDIKEEVVDLNFKTTNGQVDQQAENKMLELLNKERTKRGLNSLTMDEGLREVARAHSKDMFARGYFAHINLDGLSPFDRIKKAGINAAVAGENLALAPNVDLAHLGLMNSPSHRENILYPTYNKVGIGVINGGNYGEMFTQDFTN